MGWVPTDILKESTSNHSFDFHRQRLRLEKPRGYSKFFLLLAYWVIPSANHLFIRRNLHSKGDISATKMVRDASGGLRSKKFPQTAHLVANGTSCRVYGSMTVKKVTGNLHIVSLVPLSFHPSWADLIDLIDHSWTWISELGAYRSWMWVASVAFST